MEKYYSSTLVQFLFLKLNECIGQCVSWFREDARTKNKQKI